MKKHTKVLLAAAMLTLGASFSAMAAETKGTWVLNDEGWQYADKDGDYMDNVWAKSNGIEYWVNDDEVLGSNEWVKEEVEVNNQTVTRWYYAQSDGSKAMNTWKYLYSFNDEDEEFDEHWYYFDAKGRMLNNTKKDINGSTYYFNANGEMLTGWVDTNAKLATEDMTSAQKANVTNANLVYANEDGQVVKKSWINVFPWNKEDAYEGEDEQWFYTDKNGKLILNDIEKINDLSYIFDANGYMLTKWVGKNYAGNFAIVKSGATINQVDSADLAEVYYCDADYGYVKKNGWREIKEANGDDTFWFHFDKLGRVFMATNSNVTATAMDFVNGEAEANIASDADATDVTVASKKIDGVVYYFNNKGEMIDGLQNIAGDLVYLEGGARQTGKVTLTDNNENDYTFYFGEKKDGIMNKYIALNGAYKNYVYVNGQLITSEDKDSYKIVPVNGQSYIVDHNGKIQHKDGKDYGVGAGKYEFHATEDYIVRPYVESNN